MSNVYHLDLDKKKIRGAKIALLPGDPFRSQIIAEKISETYKTKNEKLTWKKELKKLHVLNYEMESSTVLTLTASMGLKGGCITGVVNKIGMEKITKESLRAGQENAIQAAIAAVEYLL